MHTVENSYMLFNILCQAEAYCQYLCCIINAWKSGILVGKKATYSHPTSKRKEQLKNFGAIVQNDLIVQDGNIITSSNPTAFDVAFLLLEKLTSKKNAEHVKDLMGF